MSRERPPANNIETPPNRYYSTSELAISDVTALDFENYLSELIGNGKPRTLVVCDIGRYRSQLIAAKLKVLGLIKLVKDHEYNEDDAAYDEGIHGKSLAMGTTTFQINGTGNKAYVCTKHDGKPVELLIICTALTPEEVASNRNKTRSYIEGLLNSAQVGVNYHLNVLFLYGTEDDFEKLDKSDSKSKRILQAL